MRKRLVRKRKPVSATESTDSILIEARARVLWGDPEDEIRQWMQSQGASEYDIRKIIGDAQAERAAEIRGKGFINLFIGIVLVGLATVAPIGRGIYTYDASEGIAAVAFFFIGGLWLGSKGIQQLIMGSKISGSISDID